LLAFNDFLFSLILFWLSVCLLIRFGL